MIKQYHNISETGTDIAFNAGLRNASIMVISSHIDKFGQEKFDELRRRHKTIRKFKNFDLEELLKEVKELA